MKKRIFYLVAAIPMLCLTSACGIAAIDKDANIDQWYNESTGEIEINEQVDIDWWTWGGNAAEEIFTNIANVNRGEFNVTPIYTTFITHITSEFYF